MLQNADNPYVIETVKIDSKLRDAYNLIRPIRFPDRNTKTNAKYNAKLTNFPYNQLLYDVDIPAFNNHYLRMIFTPNTLNAREYDYFAYKLDI